MPDAQTSPADLYADARDELIAALIELDDDALAQSVPSCPAWTVKDVAAHVCGLNAEKLAGVQGSLGIDEATTRQVGDRVAMSLAEVIDEWRSHSEPIAALMEDDPNIATAFLADLVVHAYDLVEVLGQPVAAADAATPISSHRYVPLLQTRVSEQLGVDLTVELTDGTKWPAPGDDGEAVTVVSSPHDFLRGVTGRHTRAQVETLNWSSDPAEILDKAWNQYGSFRAAD